MGIIGSKLGVDPMVLEHSARRFLASLLFGLFLVSGDFAAPALSATPAAITRVANPAELRDAVAQLRGSGGIIRLRPGTYDLIEIADMRFSSPLILEAGEGGTPPIVQALNIRNVQNLQIRGLTFEPADGKASGGHIVTVETSRDIVVSRNLFQANTRNPSQRIRAALFREVSGVTAEDNVISGLDRGFIYNRSSTVKVTHNLFQKLTTDALNFFECDTVAIEGNRFLEFKVDPGQHADYIQFWTRGAKVASRNIVIRHNVMLQGTGDPVQGIFMDNDGDIEYADVTIERNLIVQGSPHGITIVRAANVNIKDNLLLSSAISTYNVAIRAVRLNGGSLVNNSASAIVLQNSGGVTTRNNVLLPRKNPGFQRTTEARVLARLNGTEDGPVVSNFHVLPEHVASGPRKR